MQWPANKHVKRQLQMSRSTAFSKKGACGRYDNKPNKVHQYINHIINHLFDQEMKQVINNSIGPQTNHLINWLIPYLIMVYMKTPLSLQTPGWRPGLQSTHTGFPACWPELHDSVDLHRHHFICLYIYLLFQWLFHVLGHIHKVGVLGVSVYFAQIRRADRPRAC